MKALTCGASVRPITWGLVALALPWAVGCTDAPATETPGVLRITSGFTDEVMVLDAATGELLRTHSLDIRRGETDEPHGIAVSPDGQFWYATVSHGSPTLWKFDASDDRLIGRLELPTNGASRIGLDPTGRTAWIPDYWRSGQGADGRVARVDLVDLQLELSPEVCPAPHDAQVSPDGDVVAVACALSDEVVFLDATSGETVRRTVIEDPDGSTTRPMNVVWTPDSERVLVTLMGSGSVAALNSDGTEVSRWRVGRAPAQLALSPDGGTLIVANRGDGSVSIVRVGTSGTRAGSTSSPAEVRVPLTGADHPHGVALNGRGAVGYVTYEGTTRTPGGVVAFDIDSGEELWRREIGVFTLGIVWSPR